MAKLGNITFQGTSGKNYRFSVYPFNTKFKEGIAAVYFITRRYELDDGSTGHEYLFVGGTGDIKAQLEDHPKTFGFNKYQANSICLLIEEDPEARKEIHSDLWKKYLPLINE
ncbi:MAG: hypothetical protein AAF902_09095 [Chloroflexota bacterium]